MYRNQGKWRLGRAVCRTSRIQLYEVGNQQKELRLFMKITEKLFTIFPKYIIIRKTLKTAKENCQMAMDKNYDSKKDTLDFLRTAVPVSAALVLFLVSAVFIVYKLITAYRHNERWKDYDECGLS